MASVASIVGSERSPFTAASHVGDGSPSVIAPGAPFGASPAIRSVATNPTPRSTMDIGLPGLSDHFTNIANENVNNNNDTARLPPGLGPLGSTPEMKPPVAPPPGFDSTASANRHFNQAPGAERAPGPPPTAPGGAHDAASSFLDLGPVTDADSSWEDMFKDLAQAVNSQSANDPAGDASLFQVGFGAGTRFALPSPPMKSQAAEPSPKNAPRSRFGFANASVRFYL